MDLRKRSFAGKLITPHFAIKGHKKTAGISGFFVMLEVPSGFEPLYEVLQTSA